MKNTYNYLDDNGMIDPDYRIKQSYSRVFDVLLIILIFVMSLLVFRSTFFPILYVRGESMRPTFNDYDDITTNYDSVCYTKLLKPDYEDVVIFYAPQRGENLIKRVIGMEGDTIEFKLTGELLNGNQTCYTIRNGIRLDEPYTPEAMYLSNGMLPPTVTLGKDEYYVLGDNRNHSADSRLANEVGIVNKSQILGRAVLIIKPNSNLFNSILDGNFI